MTRTRLLLLALSLACVPAHAAAEEDDPDRAALKPLLSEEPEGDEPPPWEPPQRGACHEDEIGVLRDLRGRSAQLDRRAMDLDAREAAVRRLEEHAAEQIARLEGLRAALLVQAEERSAERDERVAELAKMVSSMKPKKAAPLLAGLEEATAVRVLEALGAKQAGKVLGAMGPGDALRLGGSYTALPDPRDATDGAADAGAR